MTSIKLLAISLVMATVSACISPPKITYCIQNTTTKQLHCSDSWQNHTFRIPYEDSHRYICISPEHYQNILDYIAEITEKAGIIPRASVP